MAAALVAGLRLNSEDEWEPWGTVTSMSRLGKPCDRAYFRALIPRTLVLPDPDDSPSGGDKLGPVCPIAFDVATESSRYVRRSVAGDRGQRGKSG